MSNTFWSQRLPAILIIGLARLLTGARSLWLGCAAQPVQRLYFANHRSHMDFVLLWSALPPRLRERTRPVAGADYWQQGRLRTWLILRVFRAVLVARDQAAANSDPQQPLREALRVGDSLILFPEGTRNTSETPLLPFKSGLYWLGKDFPSVELVPVWIDNLNRVMPKGKIIPLPLLCTLRFGEPLRIGAEESKDAFLQRARFALLDLAEEHA